MSQKQPIGPVARWVLVGVLVLGVVGIIALSVTGSAARPTPGGTLSAPVTAGDWSKGGPLTAPAVLVEYSDFQCPACGQYYPVLKRLVEEYGEQVAFVYRHFPLRQIHRNADVAARAAEAAGKQGKFWEMHDKLFEGQSEWSEAGDAEAIMTRYATELALDLAQWQADLGSDAVADKVANDYASGAASGVNGTPSFFLNGTRLPNPANYDEFKKHLDRLVGSGA